MHEITWSRFVDIDNYTLYKLLRLRSEVFVVEQMCPFLDLDGRDTLDSTEHAWINGNDGSVVAGLRVFEHGNNGVKISRVVTDATHRRVGLADRLIRSALDRFATSADRKSVV